MHPCLAVLSAIQGLSQKASVSKQEIINIFQIVFANSHFILDICQKRYSPNRTIFSVSDDLSIFNKKWELPLNIRSFIFLLNPLTELQLWLLKLFCSRCSVFV